MSGEFDFEKLPYFPYDIDKLLEQLKQYINHIEKQRKNAYKKVKEWNKDEEIQNLQNQIADLKNQINKNKKGYKIFTITPDENKKISNWIEEHIIEKHGGIDYAGAIGGRFSYRFVPTSIGEIGEVKCICGDTFCFRDLE